MTLKEIRTQFIESTGRFDLVKDTANYADDGANFFISSGQRLLDSLLPTPKTPAFFETQLLAGESAVVAADLRTLWNVYAKVGDGEVKLSRYSLEELRSAFSGLHEGGAPMAYAVGISRPAGGGNSAAERRHTIVFAPKADKDYQLRMEGTFWSRPLANDEDFNFWSLEYPQTLIQAAMYSLEKFYRNTQGMRDHMEAIQMDIRGIDYDVAEQEALLTDRLRDSFDETLTRPRRAYNG